MRITDNIPPEDYCRVIAANLSCGDVVYVRLDRNDGITPKEGYADRNKYLVVLGINDGYALLGGVVINSGINPRLPQEIKDYHYRICRNEHPFLAYDSFVNCSQLIKAPVTKLADAQIVGRIVDNELKVILGAVRECPRIRKIELRLFGIE